MNTLRNPNNKTTTIQKVALGTTALASLAGVYGVSTLGNGEAPARLPATVEIDLPVPVTTAVEVTLPSTEATLATVDLGTPATHSAETEIEVEQPVQKIPDGVITPQVSETPPFITAPNAAVAPSTSAELTEVTYIDSSEPTPATTVLEDGSTIVGVGSPAMPEATPNTAVTEAGATVAVGVAPLPPAPEL